MRQNKTMNRLINYLAERKAEGTNADAKENRAARTT